jgi:hypothetical protein
VRACPARWGSTAPHHHRLPVVVFVLTNPYTDRARLDRESFSTCLSDRYHGPCLCRGSVLLWVLTSPTCLMVV